MVMALAKAGNFVRKFPSVFENVSARSSQVERPGDDTGES